VKKLSKTIKTSFYGIFNSYGFVKATKTRGAVQPDQLQVEFEVKIPSIAFQEPQFKASLEITEDQLPDIAHELEMKLLELKAGDDIFLG